MLPAKTPFSLAYSERLPSLNAPVLSEFLISKFKLVPIAIGGGLSNDVKYLELPRRAPKVHFSVGDMAQDCGFSL